jgi:hypothetical protein
MKPFLLSFSLFFILNCSAQQKFIPLKKDNFFVSVELSKKLGTTSFYSNYGLSLAYNHMIAKTHFGIGAGIEVMDIRSKKLGGLMPSIDLRYYITKGRSTFMPMIQAGYNIYNYQYYKLGSGQVNEVRAGPGYSFGIGYSYRLNNKGSAIYLALRYRAMQYKYTDPILPPKYTSERIGLSVGWRF